MCHHVANVSPPLSFTFLRGRSEEWEPVTRERETAASLPTHAWYGLPTADAVSREIEKWLGKNQRARPALGVFPFCFIHTNMNHI